MCKGSSNLTPPWGSFYFYLDKWSTASRVKPYSIFVYLSYSIYILNNVPTNRGINHTVSKNANSILHIFSTISMFLQKMTPVFLHIQQQCMLNPMSLRISSHVCFERNKNATVNILQMIAHYNCVGKVSFLSLLSPQSQWVLFLMEDTRYRNTT